MKKVMIWGFIGVLFFATLAPAEETVTLDLSGTNDFSVGNVCKDLTFQATTNPESSKLIKTIEMGVVASVPEGFGSESVNLTVRIGDTEIAADYVDVDEEASSYVINAQDVSADNYILQQGDIIEYCFSAKTVATIYGQSDTYVKLTVEDYVAPADLSHAIKGLQVLAGDDLTLTTEDMTAMDQVTDSVIGLEDVIFILRLVAGLR